MELRSLSPNFHIHVSVRDLYITTIGLTIKICGPLPGIYKSLTDTWNWDWGCAVPFLETHKWDFRCSVTDLGLILSFWSLHLYACPFCTPIPHVCNKVTPEADFHPPFPKQIRILYKSIFTAIVLCVSLYKLYELKHTKDGFRLSKTAVHVGNSICSIATSIGVY